ncbi:MAG TPA: mandelate racemase/muconate lactonizing enzyme family protein [Phycisphaeraceae bacterium]
MRIIGIDTLSVREHANVLWVRLHTDAGLIGCGETYYTPRTTAAYIHEVAAPILLGQDPRDIERLWWRQYEASHIYGNRGCEMRAISAIDIALWDLLAQAAGMPLHRLLGGAVRQQVPLYNTCAGSRYARATPGVAGFSHHQTATAPGPMEDLWAAIHQPAQLARELLDEGIRAMKIWPFDPIAERTGGLMISNAELEEGLRPVRAIREAVGDQIEILIEGHCLWALPAAVKIAEALQPYRIYWLEDMLRAESPEALAMLRQATSIPIAGSERKLTRWAFEQLLHSQAVSVVMVDPMWAGGISEAVKVAHLASAHELPVVYHDCAGPLSFWADVHLSFATPHTPIQESVRAYYRGHYSELVTAVPDVRDGAVQLPTTPGLGATLRPELLKREDASREVSGRLVASP